MIGNSGSNYKANVENIRNFNYSTVSFQPKVLDFVKTNIEYEMNTYGLDETTATGFEKIPAQDTTYFLEEKQIYSRTNEINDISGTTIELEDTSGEDIDILSNGFKPRDSAGAWNVSGGTYIYAAFAENPFKYANAR